MTDLRQALADYLRIRRQLGFKLTSDQRLLENFVAFLERAGAVRITPIGRGWRHTSTRPRRSPR
jgi:hypothetical protein